MDELRWLDATEVAGLIATGSVSVEEVVDASLARIEALNRDLNAQLERAMPWGSRHPAI